ncbi:hypothetical protein [Bosea sp. 685]|uniref:hypothetical protein n=1 Tax=Bosea sp. 685 TaxID=3080057 RepID=UPI00289368C8|nr:hypothetical protein [Bosea sp. 685]WNJ92892.1 hypothetical protein RMR04_11600 [Bosea sp. 685]
MSFANFLRAYEATPPERLDGYVPSDFEGLSAEELGRARAMLLERALRGDTIDLDGLRLAGDAGTVSRLIAAEGLPTSFGSRFDVVRRETVFALTGDHRHLAGLFAWIDDGAPETRLFAAEALARHALPAELAAPIVARLAGGLHEAVAIPLVKAWLATEGEPVIGLAAFQRRLPLVRAIVSATPSARPGLMAELVSRSPSAVRQSLRP